MIRPAAAVLPLLIVLAAPVAARQAAAPAQTAAPTLSTGTRTDLTCAAAFAIVASEQQRGVPSALAFPALGIRGKEFFVRAGARAMDEAGLSREAVRTLFEAEVAALQRQASGQGDPDAALRQVMPGCLTRLNAAVAQLEKPSLAQCRAIMQLGYEELHAREGLTPRARDLKTLASVLESREREALRAKGLNGTGIDKAVVESHDAMRAETAKAGPGVERYDLQICYDYAKPTEGKHF